MNKNDDVAIDDGQEKESPPAGPLSADAEIDTEAMEGAPGGAVDSAGAAAVAAAATGAVDLEMQEEGQDMESTYNHLLLL